MTDHQYTSPVVREIKSSPEQPTGEWWGPSPPAQRELVQASLLLVPEESDRDGVA